MWYDSIVVFRQLWQVLVRGTNKIALVLLATVTPHENAHIVVEQRFVVRSTYNNIFLGHFSLFYCCLVCCDQ